MKTAIATLLVLFAVIPTAQSVTLRTDKVPEYPYPAEPQYQYPMMDARGQTPPKCPKGQALFQGKCRIIRRVD